MGIGTKGWSAEFAVASIRRWRPQFGIHHYPGARQVIICADSGGSNAARNRAWKYYLQQFSDEVGLVPQHEMERGTAGQLDNCGETLLRGKL